MRVTSNGVDHQLSADGPPLFIGRGTSCGLGLTDLMVSSRHAQVAFDGSTWLYEDLGSVNGTFLNGQQVERVHLTGPTELRLGDPEYGPVVRFDPAVAVSGAAPAAPPAPAGVAPVVPPAPATALPALPGLPATPPLSAPAPLFPAAHSPHTAQPSPIASPSPIAQPPPAGLPPVPAVQPPAAAHLAAAPPAGPSPLGEPEQVDFGDAVVFGVYDLTVETAGVRRLDRLSFTLRRGEMLGVLGGSGAGKSTLLKAITGSDPANSGAVRFEGRDLYRDFEHLRQRVGYVPQDDILHSSLTVRATLDFGSMLRMPDATPAERTTRVREVVDELGLTHRFDAKVTELSGGQRKRLNVALELLSRPPLLILDEPTSGLDPANERSLMQLLRQLADGGRTVIVVTHSTESLHLCNQVLFLARGGAPAYLGPPSQLAATFGTPSLIDAFGFVDNHPDPAQLRARFDAGRAPLVAPVALPSPPKPAVLPWQQRWAVESDRIGHDFWILLRRSVAILRGDKRNAMILAAQGPVIAVLMLIVFGAGKLDLAKGVNTGASSVLLALVLAVVFVGAAGSVREIVKERSILLREQAVGVSTAGYVASKLALQGALVTVQAIVIVTFTLLRQGGPDKGFFWFGSTTEIAVAVVVTGLGAVALGLLISAVVTSADKAMTLLPVALFLQLLLAGVIVPVTTIGIQQLSWFVGAQWGLDAVGAVDGLWNLRGCGFSSGASGASAPSCSGLWKHETGNWVISMVMLTALFVGMAYGTFRVLRRRDPVVVLAASAVAS